MGTSLSRLRIEGMDCSGCALGIEKHLRQLGTSDVSVDFGASTAYFRLGAGQDLPEVAREIERLGYRVAPAAGEPERSGILDSLEAKLLFCSIWTIPLFMHMFVDWRILHSPLVQLVLCLPVTTVGLAHFGRSGLASMRAGLANMDVLIFIGVLAAFVYSLAGLLLGLGQNFMFFETSASIVTLVLLGNVLEKRCVIRATSAIEELSRLQVSRARRIERDGQASGSGEGAARISDVDAEEIEAGDRVLVNTGDRVPGDGTIYWGEASIDESMITGESLPVEKGVGSGAIGGTLVVRGSIKLEIGATKEESVLGNIIRLVREAQSRKPAIQRIGDRVSAVFVPLVVAVAALTLLISWLWAGIGFSKALLNGVAVLVVACPCAVGLATPAAIIAGIGKAARHGILVKGGDTLEDLASIRSVILDKTGTLTTGRFKIRRLTVHDTDERFARSVIASLERHSSHPIALSLLDELAGAEPLELREIEEKKGLGITGRGADGVLYELGSPRLAGEELSTDGYDLYLLADGRLIASLAIEDEVRPDAALSVAALKKMGLHCIIVSGDSAAKCARVARATGIEEVFSEKLPEEKLRIVADLEAKGLVAFVGDGINDAPSLARARVGISLSDASQVAIQSARVVLLRGELDRLVSAIRIARMTFRTIRQNLFWAFFYNVMAIPVAAAGFLTPTLAALAMAFSDMVVVANSLLLKARKV